jgi:hypothetical protein
MKMKQRPPKKIKILIGYFEGRSANGEEMFDA